MAQDDKPQGRRKNPWDKPGVDDHIPPPPWSRGPAPRPPSDGPDLDELLRRARRNFKNVMPGDANNLRYAALAALALLLVWLASGFYIVAPGEQAVIQRFGGWLRTDKIEGLHYHWPAPVETDNKVNVNQARLMTIGYTDGASGGGKAGRHDIPEESQMLTADRNIVDLNLVVQWNVKNAEDYLFSVKDQENTIKKVAESAIREVVGQTDMFPLITSQRKEIADRTKAILQQNLDDYKSGVNISQVLIEKAEVHPDVQAAFQDVQSAKQDAQDVQNRAETYRQDILPRARGQAIQMLQEAAGYKETVIAKANGDSQRFSAMAEAYKNGPDVTRERIYLETMEDVLKNARKMIVDDKTGHTVLPYYPSADGSKFMPLAVTPLNLPGSLPSSPPAGGSR